VRPVKARNNPYCLPADNLNEWMKPNNDADFTENNASFCDQGLFPVFPV